MENPYFEFVSKYIDKDTAVKSGIGRNQPLVFIQAHDNFICLWQSLKDIRG